MIVVTMVRRNRVPQRQLPPTHLLQRNASLSTIQTQVEKTTGSSNNNNHHSTRARSHSPFVRRRRKIGNPRVCFSNEPPTVYPSTTARPYRTESEHRACFYSKEDIQKFDKDRAYTVLMYRARRNSGAPWNDDEESVRGVEESLSKDGKLQHRIHHRNTVLAEQRRLRTPEGREELCAAAKSIHQPPHELQAELLRGVSCAASKQDKHRALALALKDQKSAVGNSGSARQLLRRLKVKLSQWSPSLPSSARSLSNASTSSNTSSTPTGSRSCLVNNNNNNSNRSLNSPAFNSNHHNTQPRGSSRSMRNLFANVDEEQDL